jgi:Anti-sigma-K factor rskA, C-terminal
MDHAGFRELAAGAVLDDLDGEEQVRFEAHRAGCRSCGSLVEDLLDVTAELATLVPARAVPASLRGSVLAAIARTGRDESSSPDRPSSSPGQAASSSPDGPASPPVLRTPGARLRLLGGRWTRHRLLDAGAIGLAAALAVLAIGLAGRSVQLAGQLAESRGAIGVARTELANQSAAMALAADPAHRDIALQPEALAPTATAVVMYVPGTTASYVMASGLPATPAGTVYELWVADERGVHGLGTYAFDGHGAFVARLGVDLASAAAAMITLEPAGGSTGTPGPQVVFGAL